MRNLIFVKYDITQTELLFAQSLRSICSMYVDTPRVILLVTDFFIKQPETCSTMRGLGVLSSAYSRNTSARQGAYQALAIQVDRCIAQKSKIPTKTLMGFREGLCTQYFQIRFSE